jgi:hypothetical protein
MLTPKIVIEPKARQTSIAADFWVRICRDEQLRDCDDLKKLLVGCELIAALDEADLLAA